MVLPSAQNSDVKKRSSIRLPFIVASILSFLITTHIVSARTLRVLPYQDESLSIEKRVDDLVSRMTLEEKISQMTQ
jgi:hypothetical protein